MKLWQHWNSNGKSPNRGFLTMKSSKKSISKWLQQCLTTGNSLMTAKTRQVYITGIMTSFLAILKPSWGLFTPKCKMRLHFTQVTAKQLAVIKTSKFQPLYLAWEVHGLFQMKILVRICNKVAWQAHQHVATINTVLRLFLTLGYT